MFCFTGGRPKGLIAGAAERERKKKKGGVRAVKVRTSVLTTSPESRKTVQRCDEALQTISFPGRRRT